MSEETTQGAGACERPKEGEDLVICRCEEVTLGEVLQVISEGASVPRGENSAPKYGCLFATKRSAPRLASPQW
jgi:hypothetical protein